MIAVLYKLRHGAQIYNEINQDGIMQTYLLKLIYW